MLAFAGSSLLYAPQLEGILGLSKIVLNLIFSAGVTLLMHFTESRFAPQFFFADTIGAPRFMHTVTPPALDGHASFYEHVVSAVERPAESVVETRSPAISKVQLSLVSPRGQKLQPELDDANVQQDYVAFVQAYLVEIVVFSSFVLGFIHRFLSNLPHKRPDRTRAHPHNLTLPSTSGALSGEATPPNDSGDPGRNQRQPGGNRREFNYVRVRDFDSNNLRNWFARGGPPPPPPPPPAFVSSMQHGDKWIAMIDWVSLFLLLPVIAFILKRLFGRGRKSCKKIKRVDEVLQKAGICPNVVPLRERRPSPTTVRWMLPNPSNHTLTGMHPRASYPVNLTGRFMKFLRVICSMALSFLFPVVFLMVSVAAWYYLPDVILPVILDRETLITENSNMDTRPEVEPAPLRGDLGDVTTPNANPSLEHLEL